MITPVTLSHSAGDRVSVVTTILHVRSKFGFRPNHGFEGGPWGPGSGPWGWR